MKLKYTDGSRSPRIPSRVSQSLERNDGWTGSNPHRTVPGRGRLGRDRGVSRRCRPVTSGGYAPCTSRDGSRCHPVTDTTTNPGRPSATGHGGRPDTGPGASGTAPSETGSGSGVRGPVTVHGTPSFTRRRDESIGDPTGVDTGVAPTVTGHGRKYWVGRDVWWRRRPSTLEGRRRSFGRRTLLMSSETGRKGTDPLSDGSVTSGRTPSDRHGGR